MTSIDLPEKISIFPLSNVIFFPKTILPLNIFENRYVKLPNPLCINCQARMHSIGKNAGYKCRICGTKASKPNHKSILPDLDNCWYEPPSSARRHLSRPAALMD